MTREDMVRERRTLALEINRLRAERVRLLRKIKELDAQRKNRGVPVCRTPGCHNLTSKQTKLAKLGTYYKCCDACLAAERRRYLARSGR